MDSMHGALRVESPTRKHSQKLEGGLEACESTVKTYKRTAITDHQNDVNFLQERQDGELSGNAHVTNETDQECEDRLDFSRLSNINAGRQTPKSPTGVIAPLEDKQPDGIQTSAQISYMK